MTSWKIPTICSDISPVKDMMIFHGHVSILRGKTTKMFDRFGCEKRHSSFNSVRIFGIGYIPS